MTPTERTLIATCSGLVVAVLVWLVSTLGHFPHVWPGTIVGFALTTLQLLLLNRPKRGRR